MKKVLVISESGLRYMASVHEGIGMRTLVIKKATIVKKSCGYPIYYKDIPQGFSQINGKGDYLKYIRD
jgi:hypothetical protein